MRHSRGTADTLSAQAGQDLGTTSSGNPAEMGKSVRYLLNPRFTLWLQGYPSQWADVAPPRIAPSRTKRGGRSGKSRGGSEC